MWNQSAKHNTEKHIFVHPKMLLLIINNIHNLSFLFSGYIICLCKINVVILLNSVELLILFHHTSPKWMANLEYN